MIGRYIQSIDGATFRKQAFADFAIKYRPCVVRALEILRELEFESAALNTAHREQLRPDLIFRQALPFCVTEETYFELQRQSSTILAALLAGHTLALTHLDYHLDGAEPDPDSGAAASKLSLAMAMTYSVRMVYVAGRILEADGQAVALFSRVFDRVSGFVLARMYQDSHERYSVPLLHKAELVLAEYLDESSGRAEASGYWEVMVRGSFVSHDSRVPDPLVAVIKCLRRLRQVVDEIADFNADVCAGLVTLPLLFAMRDSAQRDDIVLAVENLWRRRTRGEAVPVGQASRRCREWVLAAGGFERSFELADSIWRDAVATCAAEMGRHAHGYLVCRI